MRRDADDASIPGFNAGPTSVSLKASNVIGGAHIGCNYQAGVWVFGVEGDWSGTKLSDSETAVNTFANGTPAGGGGVLYNQSTKWLASARLRLGVAVVPTVLLYVTGGAAWAKTDFDGLHVYSGGAGTCPNCSATSFSNTSSGWVAGAGAEWAAWSSNWLVRVEYLYYGLGSANGIGIQQSSGLPTTSWQLHRLDVQEARIGLSYLFNSGPVVAKY
jgi:outer membrane immunogenic protein